MGKLDYIDLGTGNDARRSISDQVDEVLDVSHLGPFKLDRNKDGRKAYYYNNTEEDERPPIMIFIYDDAEIKAYTTAYGEPTTHGGMCKLARKAFPRDESAEEWFKNNFTVDVR